MATREPKRRRTSRWEETEKKEVVSEIAKKLSNIVKKEGAKPPASTALPALFPPLPKQPPPPLNMGSNPQPSLASIGIANASTHPTPLASISSTGIQSEAEVAKARALAQANLLSQSLPPTQLSPQDFARRIYIGNLYYELKEEDIRIAFAPVGVIASIDLSSETGSNRSKGYCFLEYDDALAAESAVQLLNGSHLGNRAIKVGRPHRGQGAIPGADPSSSMSIGQKVVQQMKTKCIYIGSVRPELNSHHLESIFAPFGKIRVCVMAAVSPQEPSVHRGYGFIEFEEESVAETAITHMNNFELAGQNLKVGKASASAIIINSAISSDKVVNSAGEGAEGASKLGESLPHNGDTLADEEDVHISADLRKEMMQKLSREVFLAVCKMRVLDLTNLSFFPLFR